MGIPDLFFWFCKVSRRSELLFITVSTPPLSQLYRIITRVLMIMIKKAQDQGCSTFRVDCLP